MPSQTILALLIALSIALSFGYSDHARISVASNFYPTLQHLAKAVEDSSNHHFTITAGSTGKLYAQIQAGAPFDLFFSADDKTPRKLGKENSLPHSNLFTYAHGRLAFWIPGTAIPPDFDLAEFIQSANTKHIAIANPKLAPYGKAAILLLENLGLADTVRKKLIFGENISQAFHFTSSGATDAGFVAHALLISKAKIPTNEIWLPDTKSYPKIRQSVLLLTKNKAAQELFDFLKTDAGRTIIQENGYELPDD